jgi:hypothetical protein
MQIEAFQSEVPHRWPYNGAFAPEPFASAPGYRSEGQLRRRSAAMPRTYLALAVALAVSFGVVKPTMSPIREVPLSKSDILLADNTSEQGSTTMGKGSSDNSSGQVVNEATKSDKTTGSSTK